MRRLKEFESREIMYDQLIPKNKIGCELGVCKGNNAVQLYFNTKPLQLHLVDRWEFPKHEEELPHIRKFRGSEYFCKKCHYEIVKKKFKQEIENKKVQVHKTGTCLFLENIKDNYLDWIYIDSNHQYEHTFAEIDLSIRKVKNGGLIMGHDFQFTPLWGNGIIKAVIEHCQSGKIEMIAITEEHFPTWVCVNKK